MGRFLREAGENIAKIILFGSVARGNPARESDVDLLVFCTQNLDEMADLCADLQMETYYKYSESIEALVYPIEVLRKPGSYFLYRAINYGEEVYSMNEEELKIQEARNLLRLAEEYIEGAELTLNYNHFRIAIDTAYNAAELCAKGLLLFEIDELPTSHGGIIGEFGRLYVKPGKVPTQIGRQLNKGLEIRNKARYDLNADISKEKAEGLIELTKRIKALLAEKLG